MKLFYLSATAGYQKRIETKKATVIYKKKKKAKNVQESEIKNIINQMKSGDFKSFPKAVLDMYKHVRKDEFVLKSEVKCVPMWVESFYQEYHKLAGYYKDIRDYNLEVRESVVVKAFHVILTVLKLILSLNLLFILKL